MFLNNNPKRGVAMYLDKALHAQACETFHDHLKKKVYGVTLQM